VTIHERLIEIGADDSESRAAESLLARFVPLGRPIVLTDELVAAARAGDVVLVASLLAPEDEPDADEILALRELDEGPAADRELIPLDL
jgi:hypothetical protein